MFAVYILLISTIRKGRLVAMNTVLEKSESIVLIPELWKHTSCSDVKPRESYMHVHGEHITLPRKRLMSA